MTFVRRTSINRSSHIRPETVAYLRGAPWPEGTPGMSRFWHQWATTSGHRHGTWKYTIEEACQALGVDVEELRRRYGIEPRRAAG